MIEKKQAGREFFIFEPPEDGEHAKLPVEGVELAADPSRCELGIETP